MAGVESVFLPQPASRLRAAMLPCVEAPLGESTVLLAATGPGAHRVHWSSCAGKGRGAWGGVLAHENTCLTVLLPRLSSWTS